MVHERQAREFVVHDTPGLKANPTTNTRASLVLSSGFFRNKASINRLPISAGRASAAFVAASSKGMSSWTRDSTDWLGC